ncbi:hypothetical protein SCB71_20365 [Herbiconiux sp. KACC 21604]|uniref:hypothetical protein n=1 Tax=unclassified Herbiconiux TaxID=2618217 RepID=UPI001490F66D|nr:hypothetical protein [Herbiconiux sp. SALV-R1]QJU55378.1 hypothetical protein HL652_18290 [Herbiconiux sp. SALV-R1]WPO86550.1 hypothetical protein SCB71_20365 [Herbiconiux sp. KACC 21604]
MTDLDVWFEWATVSPFWYRRGHAVNGISHIGLNELPLSSAVRAECARLSLWYDTSLNWDYPPDPGPWSDDERTTFDMAVAALVDAARRELGPGFDVRNCQTAGRE